MSVDCDRCWIALKAYVVSKRSHGAKDLLAEMARIEVESQVPDAPPQTYRFTTHYPAVRPLPGGPDVVSASRDGDEPIPLTARGGTHGSNGSTEAG